MIDLLQLRVNQLELMLDNIDQEGKSDSLLINIVNKILLLPNIKDSDIVIVQQSRVGSNNAQKPGKVAPLFI